jgi:hypothetical protein
MVDQVNDLAPNRSTRSDGWIGDPDHQARDSDHNPWLTWRGVGIVTAQDITHDPDHGLDAHALADRLVALAASGKETRLKYAISRRRIASAKTRWRWTPFGGENPHEAHAHFSVSATAALFDSRRSWQIGEPMPTLAEIKSLIPTAAAVAKQVWSTSLTLDGYTTTARTWLVHANRKAGQAAAAVDELSAVVDALAGRTGVTPAEIAAIRQAVRDELADAVVDVDVNVRQPATGG